VKFSTIILTSLLQKYDNEMFWWRSKGFKQKLPLMFSLQHFIFCVIFIVEVYTVLVKVYRPTVFFRKNWVGLN